MGGHHEEVVRAGEVEQLTAGDPFTKLRRDRHPACFELPLNSIQVLPGSRAFFRQRGLDGRVFDHQPKCPVAHQDGDVDHPHEAD